MPITRFCHLFLQQSNETWGSGRFPSTASGDSSVWGGAASGGSVWGGSNPTTPSTPGILGIYSRFTCGQSFQGLFLSATEYKYCQLCINCVLMWQWMGSFSPPLRPRELPRWQRRRTIRLGFEKFSLQTSELRFRDLDEPSSYQVIARLYCLLIIFSRISFGIMTIFQH